MNLDSGRWVDKVDETCLEQLQNVSKMCHPHYLTMYLPIHHYGIHKWRLPKAAPTVVEAADGGVNG